MVEGAVLCCAVLSCAMLGAASCHAVYGCFRGPDSSHPAPNLGRFQSTCPTRWCRARWGAGSFLLLQIAGALLWCGHA